MKPRALLLALILAGFPLLESSAVVNPTYDSKIVIHSEGSVGTLDPIRIRTWPERLLAEALFEGLVRTGKEGIEPALAARWDILEKGRIWVFHLRAGIRFADGTPIEAQSFVSSWKRLTQEVSSWAWLLSDAEPIAVDSLTLRVELDSADPDLLERLALPQAFAVRVAAGGLEAGLSGSGPFRYGGIDKGAFVVMPRLDYYGGRPYPAQLTVLPVPFGRGSAEKWAARGVHLVEGGSANQDSSAIPVGSEAWLLILNSTREPLSKSRARRVVAGASVGVAAASDASMGLSEWTPVRRDSLPIDPDPTRPAAGAHELSVRIIRKEGDPVQEAIVSRLSSEWRFMNIGLTSLVLGAAAYDSALARADFDIAAYRWDIFPSDSLAALELARRPEISRAARGEASPSTAREDFADLVRRDILVPLWIRERKAAVRRDLSGVPRSGALRFENAWIKPWLTP